MTPPRPPFRRRLRLPERPFRPVGSRKPFRPFEEVPVRVLIPNMITLLGLCAGLTAIRLAVEGRMEWAVGAIVVAAILDGVDGRVARMLKGTSKFGAELDSLADFVNFGVAPALILYLFALDDWKNIGWIAAMAFAIGAALRLARFNVMLDDPNRPAWAAHFFTGVPAPAGALLSLLPLYLHFAGVPPFRGMATATLLYVLAIGLLMVSRVPTFSGKKLGRVPREWVLPLFIAVVVFVGALVSYPWEVLSAMVACYLLAVPVGILTFRRYQATDAVVAAAPSGEPTPPGG